MTDKPYSLERARRGLKHFAIGRVLVGLAGVALLLLTIRRLGPSDFGTYISLVALQEIISLTSSVGLFGFVQRYIPEYRLRGSREQVLLTLKFAIGSRTATLALACAVLYWFAGDLTEFLALPLSRSLFELYLLVIVVEGSGRFIDHIFDALLMQGATQTSNFVRTVVKLSGLLLVVNSPTWELHDVVFWDLVGSISALTISLIFLRLGLHNRTQSQTLGTFDSGAMARFSAYNYFALLGYQLYGFDTLKLLVTKLIGVAETATYGLAQSLADIMRKYLPAQLLLGMIRPLIIYSYSESRNLDRPVFLANLVLKLNIFLISPIIAIFIGLGEPLIEVIGKGRYPQAYGYVLVFMLLLLLQTLHLVLSILAMTAERNQLVMRGTWFAVSGVIVALLTIPIIGAWGALCAAVVSELAFCVVVARGLSLMATASVIKWQGLSRMLTLFIATVLFGVLVSLVSPSDKAMLILGMPAVIICYFVLAMKWKPFTATERETINKMLPKAWFIW